MIEELLASVGKQMPAPAIDKINAHFKKLLKLVSKGDEVEALFKLETTRFWETLEVLYSEIFEDANRKSNQLAEVG